MSKGIIALIAVGIIAILFGVSSYNGIVGKEESVTSQWAQVENAYQRRMELIPNLVATVKGYAEHEQETFRAVTEARAKATSITVDPTNLNAETIKEYQAAQGELSVALGRLMRVNENYPELKANQNFLQLQDEIAGTENRISTERNKFNEKVKEYNSDIRRFPKNIVASITGFEQKGYFQADAAASTAPVVDFSKPAAQPAPSAPVAQPTTAPSSN